MRLFNVDFRTLIRSLLPVQSRKSVMLAWLEVLVSPVVWLYNVFKTNRSANLYMLGHNSQVCYLEAALNDLFDPVSRRIEIVDGPFEDPLYAYLVPESKPLWLGLESEIGTVPFADPLILYTGDETALLGVGFIVRVPMAVVAGSGYSLLRLRALVDVYRLPGRKNYSVITY